MYLLLSKEDSRVYMPKPRELSNIDKYRLKFGYFSPQLWESHIPQLYESLHVTTIEELEVAIEVLLR